MALLLVGAIFKAASQPRGMYLAVCGTGAAVLAAYWLAFSLPPFPPRAAGQKLGYLIAAASVLSVLFASRPGLTGTWRPVLFAGVLGGLAWIAESKIRQGQYGVVLLVAIGATIALVGLLWARDRPVEAGAATLVGAFTIAGIAILAPSASMAQMALAVAAATGGYLLWTWPKPRLEFAEAGTMAIGAPLIWLGGQATLYSKASDPALAVAVAIAFAPVIRQTVFGRSGLQTDAVRPLVTGFIAAVIAAIALLIAYAGQLGQGTYGG